MQAFDTSVQVPVIICDRDGETSMGRVVTGQGGQGFEIGQIIESRQPGDCVAAFTWRYRRLRVRAQVP